MNTQTKRAKLIKYKYRVIFDGDSLVSEFASTTRYTKKYMEFKLSNLAARYFLDRSLMSWQVERTFE